MIKAILQFGVVVLARPYQWSSVLGLASLSWSVHTGPPGLSCSLSGVHVVHGGPVGCSLVTEVWSVVFLRRL